MVAHEGPFRLLTVNTAPERAKRLIGRLIDTLKGQYDITHVDNCDKIDDVVLKVTQHQPDVLLSASMWTAEEANRIHELARSVIPDMKTHAIPTGLQVERGEDAIVEYLIDQVPPLLQGKQHTSQENVP
ncbi:hypothetical protein CDD83_4870 [Cordyceps sp. RAO-2017]|nr:hypothetical protein CDD83_4870 [Cordyceps sp. RAO-2017]